jgi:putative phage-type endonuclease
MMDAQIVQLIQGSTEWHAHRANYRNASETPIVMGLSPWVTLYQLWLQKTGRAKSEMNAAMARGTQLEPQARLAYEALTGQIMQPLVMVAGDYSASLDGLTFDGSLIVEIKCPYKGQASNLWQAVEAGEVPEYYQWQIQHQMVVSGATMAHLYVFDGTEGLLLRVKKIADAQARIHAAWEAFWPFMATDTPPPPSDKDKVSRLDPPWQAAAQNYLTLKAESDAVAEKLDAAKAALVDLAKHPSETGSGVTVTRFWKQGSVDYKKVPELAGVELERYRGKAREEVRVTAAK